MMTNYEKIKNMTVEEIANYLKAKDCPKSMKNGKVQCSGNRSCRECWLDYLNQEVGE